MKGAVAMLIGASACLLAAPARALEPAKASGATSSPPSQVRSWYGWQIWALDCAFVASAVPGLAIRDAPPWTRMGGFGVWLGTPFVHGFHGNWMKVLASFGTRTATIEGFTLVGVAMTRCVGATWCDASPVALGAVTGMLAGSLIDGAVFAYDAPPKARTGSLDLSFALLPSAGGLTLGVAGRL